MTKRVHPIRPRHPRSAHPLSVVDQVVLACSPRNRLATVLGFILGGVVPVATYVEAHLDLDGSRPLYSQAATFMVAGGLVFSAKTVFAWGQRAFRDAWKAAGFVLLLEGVMITSHVPILPLVLLAILLAINGVATGCSLSLDRSSQTPLAAPIVVSVSGGTPVATSERATSSAHDASARVQVHARTRRPLAAASPQAHFSFDVAS